MPDIKNKIIKSLIKNNYISSKKDILNINLIDRGLINYVFSIKLKRKDLVAKCATGFCRFAPKIKIDTNRLEKEFDAINLWSSLVKSGHFPKIEYYDQENNILVFEKIHHKYRLLDKDLFSGNLDLNLQKKLGSFLAELHNATAYNKAIEKKFKDSAMIRQFKIPAMYRNITKDAKIKKYISALEKQLLENKVCLVHGDFKPNNIFYTQNNFYLIDFEQAHYGDPALDICYMPSIYLLAMAKNRSKSKDYLRCVLNFWKAYSKKSKFKNINKLEKNSLRHLGVIIMSRTFGITKLEALQTPKLKKVIGNLSRKLILGKINSYDSLMNTC